MIENTSGIKPFNYCVLLKQDEAPRKLGKLGLIEAPDQHLDRADGAVTRGVVLAISPLAFNYVAEDDDTVRLPQVGDRVIFRKFAWASVEGADKETYWMIEDKAIQGVLDAEAWGFVDEETADAA